MKRIAALFALVQLALLGGPALAQADGGAFGNVRTVSITSWVEEWDPATGQWVRVRDESAAPTSPAAPEAQPMPVVTTTYLNGEVVSETHLAARFARPLEPREAPAMLAQYGPFVITSEASARMVGSTDSRSPEDFDAMLRDYPGLARIDMIEAPGTTNDLANLALGRKIRAAGIATHVPRGGSVRSGAVELFLAGATRTLEDGAEFAVHSWIDTHGREADDFDADHSAHRLYLDYYVEMGMDEERARAFYAMTNSVPHAEARWFDAEEMRGWIAPTAADKDGFADALWDRLSAPAQTYISPVTLALIDATTLDSQRAFP